MLSGLAWRSLVMVRLSETLPRFIRPPTAPAPDFPGGRSPVARDTGFRGFGR